MKTASRILTAVIMIEASVGTFMCWRQTQRWEPPVVNLGKLDDETAEAIESLRIEARVGNFAKWRELGEAYLGSGYYTAAEECFGIASLQNPDDLRSKYSQGFCLERTGQTTQAIPVLKAVAEADSADADLVWTCWYQIGRCYLREENPAEAELAFRKSIDFSPAVYQLSKLLIRSNKAAEALPLIDEQLELFPNDIKFLQLKGKAAASLGDSRTVFEMRDREDRAEYLVEMEYGGKFIGALSSRFGLGSRLSRALTLKSDGSPEQQRSVLNSALEIIRKHHFWNYRSVFVAMAELQTEIGNLDEAASLIEEVRKFSADGPELLKLEGQALIAKGSTEEAAIVLTRARRLNPTVDILKELKAVTSASESRIRLQAEEIFRLGLAEFSRNHVENSLPYFEEATQLDPNHAQYFFYLGDAQRLLGNRMASTAAFTECLRINPEHGRAIQHREMLAQTLN